MSAAAWLAEPAVVAAVALLIGLCVGSFLNVVIHRLPRMMEREWRAGGAAPARQPVPEEPRLNLFTPRSRCPSCGHAIGILENVPLASWIWLRARCAHCSARISARYPLVELLAGIGAAFSFWRFGATLPALGAALFVWFTIALAFIDQETGLLPDDLTLPLVWIGLLANLKSAFVPLPEAVVRSEEH